MRDQFVARRHRQIATARHRVARVDREVEQDLLHLARIHAHRQQIVGQLREHLDVLADQPLEHPAHLQDHAVHARDPGQHHLFTTICQQLRGQAGRALARRANLVQVRAHRTVAGHAQQEQFRVALDRHQQIVEVVGDATCQPPHGLHLLRLAEPRLGLPQRDLGPPPLRQVARHHQHVRADRPLEHRNDAHFVDMIGQGRRPFDLHHRAAFQAHAEMSRQPLRGFGRHQRIQALARQRLHRPVRADHPRGIATRQPEHGSRLDREQRDRIVDVVQDQAQAVATVFGRLFRALEVRDVVGDGNRHRRRAIGCVDVRPAQFDPTFRSRLPFAQPARDRHVRRGVQGPGVRRRHARAGLVQEREAFAQPVVLFLQRRGIVATQQARSRRVAKHQLADVVVYEDCVRHSAQDGIELVPRPLDVGFGPLLLAEQFPLCRATLEQLRDLAGDARDRISGFLVVMSAHPPEAFEHAQLLVAQRDRIGHRTAQTRSLHRGEPRQAAHALVACPVLDPLRLADGQHLPRQADAGTEFRLRAGRREVREIRIGVPRAHATHGLAVRAPQHRDVPVQALTDRLGEPGPCLF